MAEQRGSATPHSARRPLKVGILLPQVEGRYGGGTAGWAELLAMTRRAEEIGLDSVWTIDHFVLAYPGGAAQGLWECWSLMAALAASTRRVEIGTLVTPTGFRSPALLAKMADTVDEISGGRLILGLGAGWVESEFRMLGLPFDQRVGRFAEALAIIHGLLKDGAVDFEGRYYSARECELRPRGPRAGGPPILIGAASPRMLRLVARYADLWNAIFTLMPPVGRPEGVPAYTALLDAACREAGRDPATLARTVAIFARFDLPGQVEHPTRATPLTGTPEELAEVMRAYARAGVAHLQVYLDPMTMAGLEALAPVLECLDRG
jgi:alkanesulfonate monooxygenase SsuD/methylene tetrahydromethanopterin reductase-like flavin-dependent oxidoreductase (luciferase family)